MNWYCSAPLYPSFGMSSRQLPLPDLIMTFFEELVVSCCGVANPHPCEKCNDANVLKARYEQSMGAIRE